VGIGGVAERCNEHVCCSVARKRGLTTDDHSEYFEITHDLPLAAARSFAKLHPESPFNFVLVSAEGATQSPGRFTSQYGRVKGQVEKALFDLYKAMPNFKFYAVRPAGVDWRHHPEIHAFMPQQALYKRALIGPIDLVYKNMITPTRPLGKLLTELASSNGEALSGEGVQMEGRLVSNVAIRRMAGL